MVEIDGESQVKKLQFNGSALESGLKVGDVLTQIDGQPIEENYLFQKYLIVEQANSVTVLDQDQERVLTLKKNTVNKQRFYFFFLVSLLGFIFLFNFTKKQVNGRYESYFYIFTALVLFTLLSLVPSSIGDTIGRTIIILFLSLFPLFLNLFINRKKLVETKLSLYLLIVAVFNTVVWLLDLFLDLSNFFIEYLSVGLFYNLGLCLLLILIGSVLSRNQFSQSTINLPLISLLSFTPLYLFYVLPSQWIVPFSVVILFTLLPLFGVFHLLILSKLISHRYQLSTHSFYLFLTLILATLVLLISLLSRFIPVVILFGYSYLLIYSLLPLIEESILMMRRKKEGNSAIALFSAVEDERESIATFIHDTVIQEVIYSMKILEEMESDEAKEETAEILEEVIFYLRELCSDIYPLMIQELGLKPALLSMIDQIGKKYPVTISTHLEELPRDLSPQQNNFILRSVKELINNSILHGRATVIDLSAFQDSHYYYFQVSDNGTFQSNQEDGQTHFGLNVIEEKVLLLKGYLEKQTENGTTITMKLPMNEGEKNDD